MKYLIAVHEEVSRITFQFLRVSSILRVAQTCPKDIPLRLPLKMSPDIQPRMTPKISPGIHPGILYEQFRRFQKALIQRLFQDCIKYSVHGLTQEF